MTTATQPYSNRIAIAFDFDDTLVHDSYDVLLESCELNPQTFRQEHVKPLLEQGLDKILAQFYSLIEESQRRKGDRKITRDHLAQVRRQLQPLDGVQEMFERLRQHANDIL